MSFLCNVRRTCRLVDTQEYVTDIVEVLGIFWQGMKIRVTVSTIVRLYFSVQSICLDKL